MVTFSQMYAKILEKSESEASISLTEQLKGSTRMYL